MLGEVQLLLQVKRDVLSSLRRSFTMATVDIKRGDMALEARPLSTSTKKSTSWIICVRRSPIAIEFHT